MKYGFIFAGLVLGGCASVDTRMPEITPSMVAAERTEQETLAFSEIRRLRTHLSQISTPILTANTALCPRIRYDIGARTHKLSNYPKTVRAGAAREMGAKTQPTLSYILRESPAARAGLRPGDELLGKGDSALSLSSKEFQAILAAGDPIRIRRDGKILDVDIQPEQKCGYDVKLAVTSDINAYATGKTITVTSGMMNFVETDEELALIIGHELAHNTMSHIRKSITNYILSGMATRYTRPFESEADYVGMYYMVRAGYNPDNVEDVWRRLALVNLKSVARAKTHPTYPNRYVSLAAARDEIKAKQAAGAPVIPNFKSGQKDP